MAKCKVCGSRVPDGTAQCPMCGAKIATAQGSAQSPAQPTPQVKPAQPARTDSAQVTKSSAQKKYPVPARQESAVQRYDEHYEDEEDEYEDTYEAGYEHDDEEITSDDLIEYGLHLLSGNPPPSDQRKAFLCFSEALSMGNPYAHLQLGQCYLSGTGTEQDEEAAYEHFSEAHYADLPEGTALMGICLYFGKGVRKNRARGKELLELAKQNGVEFAKGWLKRIRKEERREAQERNNNDNFDDDSLGGEALLIGGAALLGGLLGSLFS